MPYVAKVKSVKTHGGFPTDVSDMARNMKIELLTFSLILYQSKNCGHRIHVLFMMYDVYWYCQMKKKRMIMKILKKEWFIWKFWKRGIVEKRGRRKPNPCPIRLWVGRESGYLNNFILHFSRWTCQTFCDRCVFVRVLSFRCVECPGT